MRRVISAKITVYPFPGEMDIERARELEGELSRFYDIWDYDVEEPDGPIKFCASSDFDDDEATGSTVAFCIGEDLLDECDFEYDRIDWDEI